MAAGLQAKLLRVLEDGLITPVGADKGRPSAGYQPTAPLSLFKGERREGALKTKTLQRLPALNIL